MTSTMESTTPRRSCEQLESRLLELSSSPGLEVFVASLQESQSPRRAWRRKASFQAPVQTDRLIRRRASLRRTESTCSSIISDLLDSSSTGVTSNGANETHPISSGHDIDPAIKDLEAEINVSISDCSEIVSKLDSIRLVSPHSRNSMRDEISLKNKHCDIPKEIDTFPKKPSKKSSFKKPVETAPVDTNGKLQSSWPMTKPTRRGKRCSIMERSSKPPIECLFGASHMRKSVSCNGFVICRHDNDDASTSDLSSMGSIGSLINRNRWSHSGSFTTPRSDDGTPKRPTRQRSKSPRRSNDMRSSLVTSLTF